MGSSNSKSSAHGHYLVGIDLGTTHTVVAYLDTREGDSAPIQLFEIEQLVGPGEIAARPLLPSVRYHPAAGELAAGDTRLPWPDPGIGAVPSAVIGALARDLGAKSRGRLVASAKSWLSHAAVDRTAPILPWSAAEDVVKISPLAASASYLAHVHGAWNRRFPDAPLELQHITITIPASFDEAARSLTLEAAKLAGLGRIRLLEEPQAACYDWLWHHKDRLDADLEGIRLLLVCDIGGGTTDFTLIRVEADAPEPKLTRVGVGNHLMLGGDNVDLTLAHRLEQRLVGDKKLSSADFSQLIEQCRAAKERLLEPDAPEQLAITLLGGGARLIGGARSTPLSRDEVRDTFLEGFFPLSGRDEYPDRKRSGVVEFGLPYAAEAAVSKHIAAFLARHQQVCREARGDGGVLPDALLLNGGVFRSPLVSDRLIELLASWSETAPRRLENPHPELAVAFGAVAYALARRGQQVRIGGGSARSYFLVVADGDRQQGVCILPRGSEEGQELRLEQRSFSLRLGQPVRFHLVSSTEDTPFRPGDLVQLDEERFQDLPPLALELGRDSEETPREIAVELAAVLTEIGTVQLQCVAVDDNSQRFNLEFQLRGGAAHTLSGELHPQFPAAADAIRLVYGKKTRQLPAKAVKTLRHDLEKCLGPRDSWDTPLLRELFGVLLEGGKHRRRSPEHERGWLSLTGYCLRPGFGYPLDDWRIRQLWALYDQGIQFVTETQNWAEWWTLWRRVAGGLEADAQEKLLGDIETFINPASARQGKTAEVGKKHSYDNMLRLAAVLERIPVERKIQLGQWLLKRLQKASEPNQTWWALGRIGARVPFHGSSHNVIPKAVAEGWVEETLSRDWKKILHVGFAAVLLSRMSGDRERDLEPALRERVIERLHAIKAPESWIGMVAQVTELDEADEKRIFGEALPPGLRLLPE